MALKKNNWVVIKFGGTSVSSVDCWNTIKLIVEKRIKEGLRPLVVCSAMSGVSDQLEKLLASAERGEHKEILESLRKRHTDFATELGVDFQVIASDFDLLSRLVTGASLIREVSPRLHAQVLAFGELFSTKLGSAYLTKNGLKSSWQDARKMLVAMENQGVGDRRAYLSSSCNYEEDVTLEDLLQREKANVFVTQGFIASNKAGDTVLLGRGGSDVSASYFAAKLAANRCEIWTDVPGMYTANPRQVPSARLIKALDYDEAQEIATTGAKVLHPRCIPPVRKHKIPLHIYCLSHPDISGTIISDQVESGAAQVKAISTKRGITLVSMETIDMWHQVGFLADIFSCFKLHGLSVDLVSTSETNVTVSLDRTVNVLDNAAINALKGDLERFCKVRIIDPCSIVSLVGRNIRSILHQLGPALEVFEEQKIYLLSQAANDLNLTFVIDEEQAERLVEKLHEQLIRQSGNDDLLGSSWDVMFAKKKETEWDGLNRWWLERKASLLKLAEKKSPLYVYDEKTIDESLSKLGSLKSADKIFYSIKANAHPDILTKVYKAGFGFECVSPGEVAYVAKMFPDIGDKKILFTPNFASREEYEEGFKYNAMVTLDNIYPVKAWPELFKGKELFVRMDPGHGRGHHKFVRTAGAKSKFGISLDQLEEFQELIKKCGAKVIGLHAHVGSNVFNTESWGETALFLADVADRFNDVKYLDLGGGIGVVEKPGRKPFDFGALDDSLAKIKKARPEFELWLEPGRFIVAEAGVLLAKVTQTKRKGDFYYVGVNAGMNTLIRPALYGSHHEIVNLSKSDGEENVVANIVGPICETGDVLGYERKLVSPEEGDVLAIATTGAYGKVMSSSYNLRQPAEEIFLKNSD